MNEKALISFVIPVLNEQESLEELWQGICANVPEEYAYESGSWTTALRTPPLTSSAVCASGTRTSI